MEHSELTERVAVICTNNIDIFIIFFFCQIFMKFGRVWFDSPLGRYISCHIKLINLTNQSGATKLLNV